MHTRTRTRTRTHTRTHNTLRHKAHAGVGERLALRHRRQPNVLSILRPRGLVHLLALSSQELRHQLLRIPEIIERIGRLCPPAPPRSRPRAGASEEARCLSNPRIAVRSSLGMRIKIGRDKTEALVPEGALTEILKSQRRIKFL